MMEHSQKTQEMLYWHSDKNWFEFDPSAKHRYRLTPVAPQRARDSFSAWIKYREEHTND